MTLSSVLLRCRLVTRRWFLLPDIVDVAIGAPGSLLVLLKLFFDRGYFWISSFLVVLMTSDTSGDWNIGRKTTQRAGPRDVDVTGSAFHYMLSLTAFMTEHCGNAFWRCLSHECCGGFVTPGAVVAGGFLIFPVTVEARVVALRHGLEKFVRLH